MKADIKFTTNETNIHSSTSSSSVQYSVNGPEKCSNTDTNSDAVDEHDPY